LNFRTSPPKRMFESSIAKSGNRGVQPPQKRSCAKHHLAAAGGGACPEAAVWRPEGLVLRHEGEAPPQQLVFRLASLIFSLLQEVRTLPRSARAAFDFSTPETHARYQRPFSIQLLSQIEVKSALPDRGIPSIEYNLIARFERTKAPRFRRNMGYPRKPTIPKRLNFGHPQSVLRSTGSPLGVLISMLGMLLISQV
jgi:hypothetical protein